MQNINTEPELVKYKPSLLHFYANTTNILCYFPHRHDAMNDLSGRKVNGKKKVISNS